MSDDIEPFNDTQQSPGDRAVALPQATPVYVQCQPSRENAWPPVASSHHWPKGVGVPVPYMWWKYLARSGTACEFHCARPSTDSPKECQRACAA